MADRFCVYKATLRCVECGNTIILEGPALEVRCPHCASDLPMPAPFWRSLMEDALEDYGRRKPGALQGGLLISTVLQGATLHQAYGRGEPVCDGCADPLPVAEIPADYAGNWTCQGCSTAMPVWPAPDWLRNVMPDAMQVFGAPPPDPPAGEAISTGGRQLKPVAFACPRCAASLDIDAETPRVLTCRYCEADLFMPDDLWRHLHPVRKRTPWWVRFGSPQRVKPAAAATAAQPVRLRRRRVRGRR